MVRPPWSSLPVPVRSWAEQLLGGRIVEATSKPSGFSTGSADVVVAAAGARAFVKAVRAYPGELSASLHRREIDVMSTLPADAPAPRLLGSYDDGDWVALALEAVDGEPAAQPWTDTQLVATLDACIALRGVKPPAGLPHVRDELADAVTAWQESSLDADSLGISPEFVLRLGNLAARPHYLDGDHLLHYDLRADNVLISPDGSAVIVDWPWAARGPGWFDALCLMFNARLYDSDYPVDELMARHPAFDGASVSDIDSVLALLAGLFFRESLRPAQAGVESLRPFQRAQADAILRWLLARLGE